MAGDMKAVLVLQAKADGSFSGTIKKGEKLLKELGVSGTRADGATRRLSRTMLFDEFGVLESSYEIVHAVPAARRLVRKAGLTPHSTGMTPNQRQVHLAKETPSDTAPKLPVESVWTIHPDDYPPFAPPTNPELDFLSGLPQPDPPAP